MRQSTRGLPSLGGDEPNWPRRLLLPVVATLAGLYLWRNPGGEGWAGRLWDAAIMITIAVGVGWWAHAIALGTLRRLAKSEQEGRERQQVLQRRIDQLQTVLRTSRAIGAALDLNEAAELTVEQVATSTRFTRVALILATGDGHCEIAGAAGMSPSQREVLLTALNSGTGGSSPVEWCRVTRQPVVIESLVRDFRAGKLGPALQAIGADGLIAVPVMSDEAFFGTLVTYLVKGEERVSTAELSLLVALAAQAAVALEAGRRFAHAAPDCASLADAVESLTDVVSTLAQTRHGIRPVLEGAAKSAARLAAPAQVELIVRNAGSPPLVVSERSGEAGRAPSGTPDLQIPITLGGEPAGSLTVYRLSGQHDLPFETLQALQTLVHTVEAALANESSVTEMRAAVDEVEQAYMGTLEALTKALELRDHETQGHSRRVVQYTVALAQMMGVAEPDLIAIMRGALLHDIGKIGIPDAILRKPGPLTAEEWEVMREHPRIGYEMLKGIAFLRHSVPIILYHHERFDGGGYPEGLMAVEIPLGARIFAVADAYDAITSDRPYRKGRNHEEAVWELQQHAGTQFDPAVIEALLRLPVAELETIRLRLSE